MQNNRQANIIGRYGCATSCADLKENVAKTAHTARWVSGVLVVGRRTLAAAIGRNCCSEGMSPLALAGQAIINESSSDPLMACGIQD